MDYRLAMCNFTKTESCFQSVCIIYHFPPSVRILFIPHFYQCLINMVISNNLVKVITLSLLWNSLL